MKGFVFVSFLSSSCATRETLRRDHQVTVQYLPLEESSILHGAVWLVQLLVRVTHVFVPEPSFPLCWDIEQSSHLLLYRICKQRMRKELLMYREPQQTSLVGFRVLLIGRDSHRWYQLC